MKEDEFRRQFYSALASEILIVVGAVLVRGGSIERAETDLIELLQKRLPITVLQGAAEVEAEAIPTESDPKKWN